jgi:hypothetical protein
MLPKLVGANARRHWWHAQIAYPTNHDIVHDQTTGTWSRDFHFDLS